MPVVVAKVLALQMGGGSFHESTGKRCAVAAAIALETCAFFAFVVEAAPPRIDAPRVEVAPKIDGVLDDPVWLEAKMVSDFTQRDPVPEARPTEDTEVRICYDARHLYIGFRCFDSDAKRISAKIMKRDENVGPDDYVFVLLDPYQTERDGLYFRLNPLGGKGEGRISSQTSKAQMEWDTVWEGDARIDDEGWTAEMAIPFRSLTFDPNSKEWGINFGRKIARKQEQIRWTAATRNRGFLKLEDAGVLAGLQDMEQGFGLEVRPYALSRWADGGSDGGSGDGFGWEAGADVFYQITPSLASTFTINTDFAETEVDERRVNLTRFPLFFPEKRDFFLEGSNFFEFGPASGSLRPFHSRTLGLSEESEKVPIVGGLKVTGREGPVGIGVLGVALDDAVGLQRDEVYAGRVTVDVMEESRIGGIFTYGDPQGDDENWVAGLDFDYKNSNVLGDNELTVKAYELMSDDTATDEQAHAFGINAVYPNRPVYARLDIRQIDGDFRPAMGFVRRPGTRRVQGFVQYETLTPESGWMREWELEFETQWTMDLDNRLLSSEYTLPIAAIELNTGDEFFLFPSFVEETLDEDFEISDGVTIVPGEYGFFQGGMGIDTDRSRPVSIDASVKWGEFYDGERLRLSLEAEWRASKFWGLEAGGDYFDIDLPAGDFEVTVGYAGLRITPSPRLTWTTLAQYDTVSSELGINSRLRWIVNSGNDVFLVYNQSVENDVRSFRSIGSEAVAKLGWTVRF